MADEIELVEPDPTWPALFAAERERLLEALGANVFLEIAHFGSTAVPGLPAKPIIDMLAVARDIVALRAWLPDRLAPLGYLYWRDDPMRERLYFVKGMPPHGARRTHHLHVIAPDSPMREQVLFRDLLIADASMRSAYAALKQDLAVRYRHDREAYTEAKSAFILDAMRLAKQLQDRV
jgi:GrpB-like predicted nucleotidyltransferase (UPF0157 family)